MKRLTENDLELENIKEVANDMKKIVLNCNNQLVNNGSSSLEDRDISSSILSSQEQPSADCSCSFINAVEGEVRVEEFAAGVVNFNKESLSVSGDILFLSPENMRSKEEQKHGISEAIVTISEKIIDLPESQIVLQLVKDRLKQENIEMSQDNIMSILKITMELIEKSPLKGLSQKELAIQILKKLLNEAELDTSTLETMTDFLDTNLIGDTIDLIIGATKGQFDINKATKVASGCFQKIFGCFTRCKNRKVKDNIK